MELALSATVGRTMLNVRLRATKKVYRAKTTGPESACGF